MTRNFEPSEHFIVKEDLTDITRASWLCSCNQRIPMPRHLAAILRYQADAQIAQLKRRSKK